MNKLLRKPSFTAEQQACLKAVLLDDAMVTTAEKENKELADLTGSKREEKKLTSDNLFSLPFVTDAKDRPPAPTQSSQNLIGLWAAYEDGVSPDVLRREHTKQQQEKADLQENADQEEEEGEDQATELHVPTIQTDVKVIGSLPEDDQSRTDFSLWGEDDTTITATAGQQFNAWEVLKDEYSSDFGFNYDFDHALTAEELDDGNNYFKILGTSANDTAAQPHVLSPPLMDSLMTFLPEVVSNENYWLKYSMVRDGASMETLRHKVRGSPRTILAIETTDGRVFGSFTSSSWRQEKTYYGSGESFLWRMRQSRNFKCASLFEQADMESVIDVYSYRNENDMVQLCRPDMIAVGGGEVDLDGPAIKLDDMSEQFGFGICLAEDLLTGTSSPCATFRNPCLVDMEGKGQCFEIVNIEIWALTPAFSLEGAERLEHSQLVLNTNSTRNARENSSSRSLR